MAAAPTFRRGDVIAKRYQVVTKSGETSLWIGYHGFDKNNQTSIEQKGIPEPDVLIKVVRPELLHETAARTHLSRELQRVKGLQHPGMPRLIDVQMLDEMLTVALIEPIQSGLSQGVLLRRMVTFRKNEGFPLAEVRQISAQLASALSYIHGQMMCHGDLRLESVILRPDGAKLCDIGLGAALPRGPYLDAVKKAGEADLLAPEVRAGKQPDPRSDVFGLASLYRHLISLGQQAAWEAFLVEKPAMGTVLVRGMAEDPGARYSSIEALIADVEAVALTGAPIRKRLAQTPLAMAVAAGRLPAEELSRPVEEIVGVESGRARRNTGGFDVTGVLAPLSGGPAAKMSIGTIPPNLSSQASTRSGRLVAASSDSSNRSKGDPSSSNPGLQPVAPSAATSSNRITMPGRSKLVNQELIEPAQPSARAMGTSDRSSPAAMSGENGRVMPSASGDTTTPIRPRSRSDGALPVIAKPSLKPEDASAGAAAASNSSPAKREKPKSGTSPADSGRSPGRASGRSTEPNADRPPESTPEPAAKPARTPSQENDRVSDGGLRPAGSSKQSPAASQPSGSSPRSDRQAASQQSLPGHVVISSRWALLGALILAALVGALVAVVVLLLLRPGYGGPPPSAPAAPTIAPLPTIAPPTSTGAASPTGR